MPKIIENRLTALSAKRLTKPGFHADGRGLYLRIDEGRRLWVFRYTWNRKKAWYSIGPERDVSLATAREEARKLRTMVRDGINPVQARRSAKTAAEEAAGQTFEAVAHRYIAAHKARWRSEKHAADWLNSLSMYAFPKLGQIPIAKIAIADVLDVLEVIWRDKPETASRVRGRIEAIIGYATAMHWRQGPNPAAWQGNLKHLLPPRAEIAPVQHFAAVAYADMPSVMTALSSMDGFGALCLRFTILTAARSSEARQARWNEIDLATSTWTIPGTRMKGGQTHRVPLSPAAMEILDPLWPLALKADDLVFPGGRPHKPLSDVALSKAIKTAAEADVTVHGCRSSFRDWAAERTAYPGEIAELALAHVNSDKTRAAYQRSDLFDLRRRLMNDWSTFLNGRSGSAVTPIRKRNA